LSGGDAELARARGRFDDAVPDAKMLRGIAAHLDAYAAGEGWRRTGKRKPPLGEMRVRTGDEAAAALLRSLRFEKVRVVFTT
jgi:hypothetical protein